MRKILYLIMAFCMLLACTNRNKGKDFVDITVSSWNHRYNDRNGEDYVRLWVNDTLLFSDTFHIDYVDSLPETWHNIEMKVATIPKVKQDSVRIRVRLIALDSILFAGKYAVDTIFFYRIDRIPYMNIDYYRELNYFRVMNPIDNPEFWTYD